MRRILTKTLALHGIAFRLAPLGRVCGISVARLLAHHVASDIVRTEIFVTFLECATKKAWF
jgi:hypothetical protein